MQITDKPTAGGATDHDAQPSYLSLPSTAPQRHRGGRSFGRAQGRGGRWLGWWLEWGQRDLQGGAELAPHELGLPVPGQGHLLAQGMLSPLSPPLVRGALGPRHRQTEEVHAQVAERGHWSGSSGERGGPGPEGGGSSRTTAFLQILFPDYRGGPRDPFPF